MATSKKPALLGVNSHLLCALTPGTLGIHDAASPDTPDWFLGDTPGTLGCHDHAGPDFDNSAYLVQ